MEILFKFLYYMVMALLALYNTYEDNSIKQGQMIESTTPTGIVGKDYFEQMEYILAGSVDAHFYYAGDVEYEGCMFYQYKQIAHIGHEVGGWFMYTVLIQHKDYVDLGAGGETEIIILLNEEERYRGKIAYLETVPTGVNIVTSSFGTAWNGFLVVSYWHYEDIRFDAVYVYNLTQGKEVKVFDSDYANTGIFTDEQMTQLNAMLEKDEVYQEYWEDFGEYKWGQVYYAASSIYRRVGPLIVRLDYDEETEKFNVVDYIYFINPSTD